MIYTVDEATNIMLARPVRATVSDEIQPRQNRRSVSAFERLTGLVINLLDRDRLPAGVMPVLNSSANQTRAAGDRPMVAPSRSFGLNRPTP